MIEQLQPYIASITTDYYPNTHPAELEPDYNSNDPDEQEYCPIMNLPFNVFIKFQTESIVYREITNTKNVHTTSFWCEYITKKYHFVPNKLSEGDGSWKYAKFLQEEILIPKIENIIKLSLILEYYNITSNKNIYI